MTHTRQHILLFGIKHHRDPRQSKGEHNLTLRRPRLALLALPSRKYVEYVSGLRPTLSSTFPGRVSESVQVIFVPCVVCVKSCLGGRPPTPSTRDDDISR